MKRAFSFAGLEMRALTLALLAASLTSACWLDEACDGTEEPPPPILLPTPPPGPLVVDCFRATGDNTPDFGLRLAVRGGTPPYRYSVDFNDGTVTQGTLPGSSSVVLDHTYPTPPGAEEATYTVAASVTDLANETRTCSYTHAIRPPRLDIDCVRTPEAGEAPLTVTFMARATGCVGPCRISWWFEDTGETVEGRNVVHTFTQPGASALSTWGTRGMLDDGPGRSTNCPRGIIVRPPSTPGPTPTPAPLPTPTPTPSPSPTMPSPSPTPAPSPSPSPANRPPVITGFTATPPATFPGGSPSNLAATVSDPDGDTVTWTLTVDPVSAATGTFNPASGSGNVVSQFSASLTTAGGLAVLRVTASDGRGGTATATVTVNVIVG